MICVTSFQSALHVTRLFVQHLNREGWQYFGLLQSRGRLADLLNGRRGNDTCRASCGSVIAGYDDVVAQIFYGVALARSRFRVVLVDDARLIQAPRPRPVIRAYRIALDRIVARMDLLAAGGVLHAGARRFSGGIAVVDSTVTRELLVASRDRLAWRDGAQSKRTLT